MGCFVVVEFRVKNCVEFAQELFGLGESLVDRDEPDVCDLIEVSQLVGDEVADQAGGDDALKRTARIEEIEAFSGRPSPNWYNSHSS